jgi:hypothetical protein
MLARLNDRLKQLEAKLAPKGRNLVFVFFDEPGTPSRGEQLAAFRAEHSIAPSDIIHEVSINFA